MAISNRDRVGRAFEQLALGLDAFITRVVADVVPDGSDWTILLAAKDQQKGITGKAYSRHDPQAQLRMLADSVTSALKPKWYPFNELSKSQRSLAAVLQETRNRWAHNESFSGDEAYRALDTVELLLQAVGAPEQADEVRKLRVDLRRLSSEQDDRKVTKAATSSVEVTGLKPWREVLKPHGDVQSGQFHAAEFAADLHQVATGQSDSEYGDPIQFFNRTYLTEGLRDLLSRAVRRVCGDSNTSPVVNLQTTFGGGKTHSMLALWHIVSGQPLTEFPQGVQDLLVDTRLNDVVRNVRRVAIVGNHLEPGKTNTRDGRPGVRTIWGELAWQLGGVDGYAMVADADRTSTSPGTALFDLLKAYSPAIILIDEWVAYARALYGRNDLPGGSFDAQFTFAQTLTEAAKATPGVFLVISIPASTDAGLTDSTDPNRDDVSEEEVGGENGRRALRSLQNVVRRIADQWRPANADESFEIVRRRLFVEPDAAAHAHINATAQAMVDFYRKHHKEFPHEATEPTYEQRIRRSYPIHPELFDRLYEDWSTLERFQRTRGVLRLMNTVVGELWRSQDPSPLIMPGSVPLRSDSVVTEMTQYLEDAFKAVIDADVDGPNAVPTFVDKENPVFGKRFVAQRLARSIFVGATPTLHSAQKGIERQRLYLGTALPGDIPGNFGSALNQLADRSTYLYTTGPKYWFDTQANATRAARDHASQLHTEDVWAEIVRRLREHRTPSKDGFAAVSVTDDSGDVPDGDDVRLVILHPRHTYDRKASHETTALDRSRVMVETRGSGHRTHRNALVVLAADATRMRELDAGVRDYLAWAYVYDHASNGLNLTPAQKKQAEIRRDRENETVTARLLETYAWLLVPEQPDGSAPLEMRAIKVDGSAENLALRAAGKLRNENALVLQRAARLIRMDLDGLLAAVWRDGHVSVGRLWLLYTSYPYLARLRDRSVLTTGISHVVDDVLDWESGGFALADGYDDATGIYSGLRLPGYDTAAAVTSDSTLLVRPDIAVAQRQVEREHRARLADTSAEPAMSDLIPGQPVGGTPASGFPQPGAPTGVIATKAATKHRFFGSRTLNPQKYGADFAKISDEIIQHLAAQSGVELKVRIEIEAASRDGFSEDRVRTVEENAGTLKFDQHSFESD